MMRDLYNVQRYRMEITLSMRLVKTINETNGTLNRSVETTEETNLKDALKNSQKHFNMNTVLY